MGILYERIYDFENLYQSALQAANLKKYKPAVLRFFLETLEENLF
jgi:hypothetical protein